MSKSAAMVRVELAWPHKHLSPNARVHWSERHRRASEARHDASWATVEAAKRARLSPPLRITTTFFPPTRRAYDRDNLSARMKAAYDGIADGLGVDDKHFRHEPVVIGEVVKGGRVEVTIRGADACG